MEYLIGFVLALAVCAFAMFSGFDRDRVFYPTVVIVNTTYYILFAVMSTSPHALAAEAAAAGLFLVLAVAGYKKNLWLAAGALAGHGVFDTFHHFLIENSGVPVWWPGFCLAFDVFAGAWLAVQLLRRRGFARAV